MRARVCSVFSYLIAPAERFLSFAKLSECEQAGSMEAESLSRGFAELSTPLIADAALHLKRATDSNYSFREYLRKVSDAIEE